MIRKLSIFLAIALALLSLSSCTYIPTVDSDVITIITVDADAKVELMVNPANNVLTATPLNELAEVIMVGESFIDQTPDEAAAQFVALVAKAGLLSADGLSTVKLSVSGDSDYAKVISRVISKKIVKSTKDEGIEVNVEIVDPMPYADLSAFCLDMGYVSSKELETITYKRLVYTLAVKRSHYLALPTEEMKTLYGICRDVGYNVWTQDETLVDLAAIKEEYPLAYEAYGSAAKSYKNAFEELKEFYISSYFGADSEYQKALRTMLDTKEAVLSGSGSAEALDNAISSLSAIDSALKTEVKNRTRALEKLLAEVTEVESSFEDQVEVLVHLRQTYPERYWRIKAKIDSFSSDFDAEFANEIKFVTDTLSARKQSLIK